MDNFMYRPENNDYDLKDCKSTIGVKFSNDIFLSKSWLDQHNIKYEDNELEDGPWGLVARIKRDNK